MYAGSGVLARVGGRYGAKITVLRSCFSEYALVRARVIVEVRWQGLTLVHFSAQLEHFLWDRGCA